jgi:single-stranded-DNA-specific exonuclease
MINQGKRWEILEKRKVESEEEIVRVLLANRGIKKEKQRKEFFNPIDPHEISLKSLGVNETEIKKAIERVRIARKKAEHVIIYGDYDADGVCSTAILWETLHAAMIDVLPHIPDRFDEGYGVNPDSVEVLKKKDDKLGLIITVDNGIVAYDGIKRANELGIDVIVIDHHQPGKNFPHAFAVVHSTAVCGAALSWFFSKEIAEDFLIPQSHFKIGDGLELAAIGTIADQLPLLGPNRSLAKFGLDELNETKRPGLLALFEEARIEKGNIGPYEVNFIIAPRINSVGRLSDGIASLRLLCTRRKDKAIELAREIGKTNLQRQKIVDEVVTHALLGIKDNKEKIIVLANESYHEGVIGLAASKLVEEFYRPAIVLSKKGEKSKASARSISGFNIIEAIRNTGLILEGGGHPMAAGFSIETERIEEFAAKINKISEETLTDEILERKLRIDLEIGFEQISQRLMDRLKEFEPTGLGNPTPVFVTRAVEVVSVSVVGRDAKHLKLKLKENGHFFDSIFFGGGEIYSDMSAGSKIAVVYSIEENVWNGYKNLQLKIKDLRIN